MSQVSVDLSNVAADLAAMGFTSPDNAAFHDRVQQHYENGEPNSPPGIVFSPKIRNLEADIATANGTVTVQAHYEVHWPKAGKTGPQMTRLAVKNVWKVS